MTTMTIQATDGSGSFTAYMAEPPARPAGAVVVIQEIFGVNASLRRIVDGFADQGYLAVAPDLFWRQKPGVDLTDKTPAEWEQALALMKGMDQDRAMDDLKATLAIARAHPACNGRGGTVGYCLGGRLAVRMALESDAAVNVSYYGVGLAQFAGEIERIGKPLVLHIAELDTYVPAELRTRLLGAAGRSTHARAHVYPGADHAFARVGGVHWHGRAAAIANGRTAETLAAALG